MSSAASDVYKRQAQITVRKLQIVNNDYVNLLKDLKDRGEYRFIIDCKVDKVRKILYAVSRVVVLVGIGRRN